MKAKNYVQALTSALSGKSEDEQEVCVSNFLAILKTRGHMSLLPQIVEILERDKDDSLAIGRLRLARSSDQEKFQDAIAHDASQMGVAVADVTVDENNDHLIGGYSLETRDKLADRTYKKKLLGLYRELTI